MISDLEYYRVKDNVNSYYRIESESKKELLLNKYPNAAAAYSLRLLDGYYRGPLVRVRRDDGVEVDVYPDYNNQLSLDSLVTNVPVHTTNDGIPDADYTFQLSLSSLGEFVGATGYSSTVAATDATVCVWYDQSSTDGVPNDNDASQSVALNQPLIVSSGVIVTDNGKPALAEHSGVFKELQVATISFSADSGSFIAVNKPTTSANEIYALGSNLRLATNNGQNGFFAGSAYIYSASSSANQGLRVAFADALDAVAVNGASLTTGNAGNSALTLTSVRIYSSFQEFVVYNSDQSANRTDIEEDINSFYQIDGYTPPQPLLDEFGGAAAAYSLRLLSSTYNGPLVRIRRTIDNTEVDVYPDSDGEFSIYSTIEDGGTELTTGVTGGSTDKTTLHEFLYGQDTDCMVVRWYDQASGNHATQDVATSQPKIYDSVSGVVTDNGKPALQSFDTNIRSLTKSVALDSLHTSNSFAVAMVQSGSGDGQASIGNPSGGELTYFSYYIGTTYFDSPTRSSANVSAYANTQGVFFANRNGNTSKTIHINQTEIINTTDTASISSGTITFGFRLRNSILVQEAIWWNDDQSSNRTVIEQNINQHYNIY